MWPFSFCKIFRLLVYSAFCITPSDFQGWISDSGIYHSTITKHGSVLYIGIAKVLPIINVLGYDGHNSSFSSPPYSVQHP